ncbi:hypothetical protein PTSG_12232 [Salpingoeca rosetta]|uniref:Uncharacterized protein n=1 Tax=Salpingoeca rosetta (strain ATCC 50818 / BSB-021) TaxID=946362 RepID=F2U949_SALR5|nr:uncharacterized protein PTSG_12232 [Salpingoeca rosetta]EGD73252.1 hypothetical protein PTSG_12232 [Salpingoeca rosetta]|eukprot:XP_004994283.1 hypothetical protein PTSG_12232 [Salpingoeca rosetta]
MACKHWLDYFLVVVSAFSLAAWATFVIGFGLEKDNPDHLSDLGWDSSTQHTLWFFFTVAGIIAGFATVVYSFSKRRTLLLFAIFTSCVALFSCGGPLDASGRFLYLCNQEDDAGKTRQGPGCQEQTYDNYVLMFLGCLIFALCQTMAVCFAAAAARDTRFSFHGRSGYSENLLF